MDWEKIKLGFWSALGGAILLAIIGFNWGGWVTGGTAQAMAKEMAASAVTDRLALICVAQFNQDPQKDQKLNELKEKGFWDQREYVGQQGWATMLGEKLPDGTVAQACAEQLKQLS